MAIPIELESPDMYENTGVYEVCIFCMNETKFWHKKTNRPVCPTCSKSFKVGDIRDRIELGLENE